MPTLARALPRRRIFLIVLYSTAATYCLHRCTVKNRFDFKRGEMKCCFTQHTIFVSLLRGVRTAWNPMACAGIFNERGEDGRVAARHIESKRAPCARALIIYNIFQCVAQQYLLIFYFFLLVAAVKTHDTRVEFSVNIFDTLLHIDSNSVRLRISHTESPQKNRKQHRRKCPRKSFPAYSLRRP